MSNSENSPENHNVGRYQIHSKIGAGAYGNVYRANDPILKREVAIKIPLLTIKKADLISLVDSFYHEAELAASLLHPNIVAVYDVGSNEFNATGLTDTYQPHYLVMEYVPGIDLSGYIEQEKTLPLDETINIIYHCCKALDYIHFRGIIHRDIKPANILINPTYNTVKLMDFSISDEIMHPSQKLKGTPLYMTPEHYENNIPLGAYTDLFALGGVMYEMLTGNPPFMAETSESLAYQIVAEEPIPVSEIRSDIRADISSDIDKLLSTAMHKDPKKRFPDALAFADALMELGESLPAKGSEHKPVNQTSGEIDQYLRFRRGTWLSNFPPDQINDLVNAAQIHTYQDGEYIIREDETGGDMYTILEGKAIISRYGQRVNTLEQGESFGELGFAMQEHKRTASIIADGEVEVLQMSPKKLQDVSASTRASLYQVFLEITMKRLQNRTDETAKLQAAIKAL